MDAISKIGAFSEIERFNPRARDGRDLYAIHACHRHYGFNPRARDGRDANH